VVTRVIGFSTRLVASLQELDIVVASLTMTSEREEVIDFIAPYFEQTGISIGIRLSFAFDTIFENRRSAKIRTSAFKSQLTRTYARDYYK